MKSRDYFVHSRHIHFFILVTLFLLFSSCENYPDYNDPVRDYLDYYTNSAAIEYYGLACDYLVDKDGDICISSEGNKTINFYLRNPRNYSLTMDFGTDVLTQDSQDKTLASYTYDSSYLLTHECGQEIGGTIGLVTNDGTPRTFESYSFSLKCNSPPPGVKGQCVQTAGGRYVVCFYLPNLSAPHNDVHKLYIGGNLVEFENVSALPSAYTVSPSGLTPLGGVSFSTVVPPGYSLFYYTTDQTVSAEDDFSCSVYLEDDAGLRSKTTIASTMTVPASGSISGTDVLALGSDDSGTLEADVDGGSVANYSWSSSPSGIVQLTQNPSDQSQVALTPLAGGVTTVSVQMELSDGRIVTKSKEIRVLSLSLAGGDLDLLKGQTSTSLSVTQNGFPSTPVYTWASTNDGVASVSGGSVSPVAKGNTTISVSASYGGKTVSAKKTVHVHEATISGGQYVFTDNNTTFSVTVSSPDGAESPSVAYSWMSQSTSVATVPSSCESSSCLVSAVSAGSSTIKATLTLNGKNVVLQRTVNVYKLNLSGPEFIAKTGGAKTFTASVSGYSEAVNYIWSSSSSSVATVGAGNSSTTSVTPETTGTTTVSVKVTINGKQCTESKSVKVCDVSIQAPSTLMVLSGKSYTLSKSAPNFPLGTSYTWTSSNTSVATVDSSGKVTGVSGGSATITLKASYDGLEITATKSISVSTLSFSNSALNSGSLVLRKGDTYSGTITITPSPTSGYGVNVYVPGTSNPASDTLGCSYDTENNFTLTAKKTGQVDVYITLFPTGDVTVQNSMLLYTVTVSE